MTGIERVAAERFQKRLEEFNEKMAALEREYADLRMVWVDDQRWELVNPQQAFHPGAIIEMRRKYRRWPWGSNREVSQAS